MTERAKTGKGKRNESEEREKRQKSLNLKQEKRVETRKQEVSIVKKAWKINGSLKRIK